MKVFDDWNEPLLRLYSTAALLFPLAIAVRVVVPPLHEMVPAEAETASVQAPSERTTEEVTPVQLLASVAVNV